MSRPTELYDELDYHELSFLSGFDRVIYRWARFLQVTGGTTVKAASKGKAMNAREVAISFLKKTEAHNFETGQSTAQVAKATGYKSTAISAALNDEKNRGIVQSEKRGRQEKYFLATP